MVRSLVIIGFLCLVGSACPANGGIMSLGCEEFPSTTDDRPVLHEASKTSAGLADVTDADSPSYHTTVALHQLIRLPDPTPCHPLWAHRLAFFVPPHLWDPAKPPQRITKRF